MQTTLRLSAASAGSRLTRYLFVAILLQVVTISFFSTAAGNEPVRKFIDAMRPEDAAKLTVALDDLKANGLTAANVSLRQIKGKLWEVRLDPNRIFYVVTKGPTMVLLHAIKKEGQKPPKTDVDLALRRMKEVLGE